MVKTTFSKHLTVASSLFLGIAVSNAQFSFTNKNSLTPIATHSGCCVTVVDINNDGLDDIVKMDQGTTLIIEMQNRNGTFTHYDLGNIGAGGIWGMAVADVDHNGWKDVACGSGSCSLVKLGWSGSTITATTTVLAGSYFVQNITFGDFDNDGWVDLAVCDDNDYMKIYKNTAGTMTLTSSLINTNINPGMTYGGDPYDSGNYGSVYLDIDNDGDLDLYIAHCRQSTSSYTDERRRDRLFKNNGAGVYTESGATTNIEPVGDFKQSWTTSFGDLDNDGDFDLVVTNHGENSQIFRNNGSGVFTDVTAGSGFSTSFDAIESFVEDFDNDGWLDILISGPGLLLYHNNHDGTYTPSANAFGGAMTPFLSFATGDLNHDGFIDLEASYGNVYTSPTTVDDVLWMNNKNANHFITFDLTGTVSNHDAIGAKVIITGAFGTQVREVRAGESYGTENSFQIHFGLGSNTSIASAIIEWPSGLTTTFGTLAADQFVTAIEGGCTITGNTIPGPFAFCTAGSVILNAAAGYTSYSWSTGATTPSITSSTSANYNVLVTNAGGCSNISPTVTTVMNPNETPTVTTSGANSCAGTLTLTSTTAAAYSWTGPAAFTGTTQSITPTVTGTYSLTTTGLCQNWTATPTVVSVLAAPSPTGTGATGPGPATFNLSAAGSGGTLNWYAAPTGGSSLTTGTNYTTPTISTTTTYYVDETTSYTGTTINGGKPNPGTAGFSGTTINGGLDFDVIAPSTLVSIKVYTLTPGIREIQLKNAAGTVINTYTINLPVDSTVVPLNFPLTVGTAYRLTTNGIVNNTSFGFVSPSLRRNTTSVTFPYNIGGLVSITNGWTGTVTNASYYYFYDWKVQTPTSNCTSVPRVPVVATVTTATGINAAAENNGVQIYPNPATSVVNITFGFNMNSATVIEITDIAGRLVKTQSFDNPVQGQTIQLNVSEINAGSYFITVRNNTQHLVQKLTLSK
jgi:hypothetical protein